MFQKHTKNTITYYTSSILDEYSIPHFFACRFGGVSCGDFDSLNASTSRKDKNGNADSPANVLENYRRALSLIDSSPEHAFSPKQIHSGLAKKLDDSYIGFGIQYPYRESDGFDASVTKYGHKLNTVCVKTADCVPILLANTKTGDVSAIHAGWRGTVSDIVTNAVKLLGGPSDIVCAIGPCIGDCCYGVGEEVYEAAKRLFESKDMGNLVDSAFVFCPTCSMSTAKNANLSKINALLLEKAGVPKQNIDISGICTCCFKDEQGRSPFFSHRGWGGHSGTFISGIKAFEVK